MNTRGTIDPELLAVIDQMPAFDFVGDLPGCRKMIDDFLLSARDGFAIPMSSPRNGAFQGRTARPRCRC